MAKINETNYPRRQASEYVSTDMLIVQPVPDPEQEHSGDSRTTRVSDLKEYMLGNADPSKIGTPAAGTYTSASNTNAQNIAALDHALANYDHLTKQVATQAEINGYIADPTTAEFNVIYLLKDTSATGSDKYFEYMRLGTPESSTFEMTGDTSTDLSNYFTKAEINAALADKVSKSVTAGLLKNDGTVDTNSYATSAEAFQTNDTAETALDDADYVPFYDTSASVKRKSLWSNIKSVLKTYFDALYIPKLSSATSGNFAGLDSNGNLTDSGKKASDFASSSEGVPTGGTTGQVLKKKSGTNYDTEWGSVTPSDIGAVATLNVKNTYQSSPTAGTEVYDAAYVNNKQAPKQYTITASSWSASQTTKDGVGYYTYSLALNPISKGRAEISIGNSATSGRLIPTDAEISAYNLIDFASTNDSTGTPLTLYAKVKPSTTFTIIVIAHEKDYS